MSDRSEDWRIWHEIGHAVAALACGCEVRSMWIPDNSDAGVDMTKPHHHPALALVWLGGYAAEHIFGFSHLAWDRRHEDWIRGIFHAQQAGWSETEAVGRAITLMTDYRGVAEAMFDAVAGRQEIGGEELRRIFAERTRRQGRWLLPIPPR